MSANLWDDELTAEQRELLIEKLARRVQRFGMEAPAILMLEMHKPLAFLASQTLILGSGILVPLFGLKNIQQYSKLLESRDHVEMLIRRIESFTDAPRNSASRNSVPGTQAPDERSTSDPQGEGAAAI